MILGWLGYFFLNLLGLILIGWDKNKARRQAWRVSEKTLFITAFIGGSLGIYLGCLIYRHKTRKVRFVLGLPVLMLFQAGLIYHLFMR